VSGPKVVRIVTREEVLAACKADLARLDAALRDWTRSGTSNGFTSTEEIATAGTRRDELAALIAADRFVDFQKGAAREIAFLASDLQVRLAKAADEQAAAQALARRQSDAARALLGALRTRGVEVPSELAGRLEAVAAGASDPGAVAEGFAALSPAGDDGAEARKRLATLHRTEIQTPSLDDWLRAQPQPAHEARLVKVARHLAELNAIGAAEPGLLAAREAAEREPEKRRRALLLDSLELNLAGAIATAKAHAALESELNLTLAALGALSAGRRAEFEARLAALNATESVAPLLTEVKVALDEEQARIAAEARRQAVLQALLGLGYEVTEGMVTAWAKDGQLVLRNSARPDYGVEILGKGEDERLQMRAVAFDDRDAVVADPTRDRDAEVIWCGEVGALAEQLKRAGTDFAIVKARKVGEVPLKRVKGSGRRGAAKPRTMTLG
jgi:hypothetical protein